MAKSLLIVGASARAMVASAKIAGFEAHAADLFNDWDTQFWANQSPLGKSVQIENFDAASDLEVPAEHLILCGGIENRIRVLEKLGKKYRVLGPSTLQLNRLRHGEGISALKAAKFLVPPSKPKLEQADTPSQWLFKPRGRAGGTDIRVATHADVGRPHKRDHYFEFKLDGQHVSAVFVSTNSPRGPTTHLVGTTQQLVGIEAFGASAFSYCGSIGPIRLGFEQEQQLIEVGTFLANEFELVGVWGVDFVVNADGVWPVDINPRITASAELFERQIKRFNPALSSIVGLHVAACQNSTIEFKSLRINERHDICEGKAILFNRSKRPLVIGGPTFEKFKTWFEPEFFTDGKIKFSIADVPRLNTTIAPGHPILTIRSRGQSHQQVQAELTRRSQAVYELLDAV